MSQQLFGEFLGTMILVLIGNGIGAGVGLKKTNSNGAGFLPVVLGWGFGLMMAVFVASRISLAHLNPAVTIAFAVKGDLAWSNVLPFILVQMLGAALGSTLVWIHYYDHFNQTEDQSAILGSFTTSPAIRNIPMNILSEAIGTFMLMFGILNITTNPALATFAPLAIGLLLFTIALGLGGTTGASLNPARDFAPRIMHFVLPIKHKGDSDWAYSLVAVVGPIIGAIVAVFVYRLMG